MPANLMEDVLLEYNFLYLESWMTAIRLKFNGMLPLKPKLNFYTEREKMKPVEFC